MQLSGYVPSVQAPIKADRNLISTINGAYTSLKLTPLKLSGSH